MKNLIPALVILFSMAFAHAESASDPYNTFLWNRDNAVAENGQVDAVPWFEWWYYKVVDPKTQRAFFFTYGVINPWDTKGTLGGTKSVVQAGSFEDHILVGQIFPVQAFSARYDVTSVKIDANSATDKQLSGHVTENGHDLQWNFSVVKNWAFDAMGWTMKLANTSGIYWYPAQASATVNGWVKVDNQTYTLENAPGYQDRNWGNGFPKWWTWLTSNNFTNSPGTALAVGGGEPKLFNSVYLFAGLCIGLHYQGVDYAFRTTDTDVVNFDIHWGKWEVSAEHGDSRIEISAYAPPDKFMMLPFESPQGATFYDYETLNGQMTVKLFKRETIFSAWTPVVTLETDQAGIEWGTPDPIGTQGLMNLFNTSTHLQ